MRLQNSLSIGFLGLCYQFPILSADLSLQLAPAGARNAKSGMGRQCRIAGKKKLEEVKRALDSAIDATGRTCSKWISTMGGRAANTGGRER